MDLMNLSTTEASNNGAWCHIRHPVSGAPLYAVDETERDGVQLTEEERGPIRVRVFGSDSAVYRKASHKVQNRRIETATKSRGKQVITAEDAAQDQTNLALACIQEWQNVQFQGEALEFNRANALKLFAQCPWMLEQLQEFIDDRGQFVGEPSRS